MAYIMSCIKCSSEVTCGGEESVDMFVILWERVCLLDLVIKLALLYITPSNYNGALGTTVRNNCKFSLFSIHCDDKCRVVDNLTVR